MLMRGCWCVGGASYPRHAHTSSDFHRVRSSSFGILFSSHPSFYFLPLSSFMLPRSFSLTKTKVNISNSTPEQEVKLHARVHRTNPQSEKRSGTPTSEGQGQPGEGARTRNRMHRVRRVPRSGVRIRPSIRTCWMAFSKKYSTSKVGASR